MTGDDDDDGISVIRSSDGSYRFRISCEESFFFITSGFSIRDFRECLPSLLLEIRSFLSEGNGESLSASGEVLRELFLGLE